MVLPIKATFQHHCYWEGACACILVLFLPAKSTSPMALTYFKEHKKLKYSLGFLKKTMLDHVIYFLLSP